MHSICTDCGRLGADYCGFCGRVVSPHPSNMVAVPAGRFVLGTTLEQRSVLALLMQKDEAAGSHSDRERPQEVTLGRSFYIDKYPVRVGEYRKFLLELTPLERKAIGVDELKEPTEDEGDLPATGMTWEAAVAYALARGKRLPTEAEWEAAAGWDPETGTKRIFPWGDDVESGQALCSMDGTLQPVFTYDTARSRSALGCCDMVGNASEWTADPFLEQYQCLPYGALDVSAGKLERQQKRSIRGGSCRGTLEECRVAWREGIDGRTRSALIGFRCAMDVKG